jgi:hypothetical protein
MTEEERVKSTAFLSSLGASTSRMHGLLEVLRRTHKGEIILNWARSDDKWMSHISDLNYSRKPRTGEEKTVSENAERVRTMFTVMLTQTGQFFPDVLYSELAEYIETPRACLTAAEALLDQNYWLLQNLLQYEMVFSHVVDVGNQFKTCCVTAFMAVVNHWFGWQHENRGADGGFKHIFNTSGMDPICVIKAAVYLYRYYVLVTRTGVDPKIVADNKRYVTDLMIRIYDTTIHLVRLISQSPGTYQAISQSLIRTSSYPTSFVLIKGHAGTPPGTEEEKKACSDAQKDAAVKCGQIRWMNAPTSKVKFDYTLYRGFWEILRGEVLQHKRVQSMMMELEKIANGYYNRPYMKAMLSRMERSMGTGKIDMLVYPIVVYICRFIMQQALWAWGGIKEDMYADIIKNSMPEMVSLDLNDVFMYTSRYACKAMKTTDRWSIMDAEITVDVIKSQNEAWRSLAYAEHVEELRCG